MPTKLTKELGKIVIDQVTIDQAIGGARDIRCLVTDISYLDPQEGIRFRGNTIPETFAALPKAPGSTYPTVESFWFFLLTGDVPTQAQVDEVVAEWKKRQVVPSYVWDSIRALPRDSHPMVMLSVGLLAMQKDSKFKNFYNSGKFNKMTAWESVYEDASDIVARIPIVAAFIYNLKYRNDKQIAIDPKLDMGANFAHMIGQSDEYKDVARMYFILHSDHESGNVSAHTTHLVHSALSDPYYAYSAGLNGLAGPLHGLANQEVLQFTYSPAGDILTLTDGKDQVTRWNYNAYGLVTNKVDALNAEMFRYQYDPNRRLTNRWQAGNTQPSLAQGYELEVTPLQLAAATAAIANGGNLMEPYLVEKVTEQEIAGYLATGEPFDKAGAYAIQGLGAFMVPRIEGSYPNVVGLPLCEVIAALEACGAINLFS